MTDADGRQGGRRPVPAAGSVAESRAVAEVIGYAGGLDSVIGREE